jgi:hypothetical protein
MLLEQTVAVIPNPKDLMHTLLEKNEAANRPEPELPLRQLGRCEQFTTTKPQRPTETCWFCQENRHDHALASPLRCLIRIHTLLEQTVAVTPGPRGLMRTLLEKTEAANLPEPELPLRELICWFCQENRHDHALASSQYLTYTLLEQTVAMMPNPRGLTRTLLEKTVAANRLEPELPLRQLGQLTTTTPQSH